MTVKPRTIEQLKLMRQSGNITAKALKKLINNIKVGVTLKDLDKIAEEEILSLGGQPSFKTVPDYYWTTCLTINDEVVHGIPRDIKLQEGDTLGVDLGTVYQGWHSDAGWSVVVGREQSHFLDIGEKALWAGIKQAKVGNQIGDISHAIQEVVEDAGYSVVRSLVGHGVGQQLHEEPEVPGFGKAGTGIKLVKNMTLAIEVIYTSGRPGVALADDNWTIITADGSLGGFFENTVVVGEKGPEILTDWRDI